MMASSSASQLYTTFHPGVQSQPRIAPPRPLPPMMPPQVAEQLIATLKRQHSLNIHDGHSRVFTKRHPATLEQKKSASSSLTMLTANKGNATSSGSLPDQRLPPGLRPLPPTPGVSSFRQTPTTSAAPVRKTSLGISQQVWYHNVGRKRGEELVSREAEDGAFLIRPSTQSQNPYTLTIWFGKRVFNIAIRLRQDKMYALGTEKLNEFSFLNVEEMVAHYQAEPLLLFADGEKAGKVTLKYSPKKEI